MGTPTAANATRRIPVPTGPREVLTRLGANQERANDGPVLKLTVHEFHDVRKVQLPGKPEKWLDKAKEITAGNGLDEIYFKTAQDDLYVAAFRGTAFGVKKGFLGRYNGQIAEVLHVDDENNTFGEGWGSLFSWTQSNIGKSAGAEMTKVVGTVAGTIVGGLVAAAAVKGTVAANAANAAVAAQLAAMPASTGAALTALGTANAVGMAPGVVQTAEKVLIGGGVAPAADVLRATGNVVIGAGKIVGPAKTVLHSIGSSLGVVAKIVVPVVGVGMVLLGVGSIIAGLRAARKEPKYGTIDMVTGQF